MRGLEEQVRAVSAVREAVWRLRRVLAALPEVAGQVARIFFSMGPCCAWEVGAEVADIARKEERRRLHRDLHDDLGPTLAGVRLRLYTAAERLTDEPAVRQVVLDAAEEVGLMTGEIRRIIDDLRPPELDRERLTGALRGLVGRLGGMGVAVSTDFPAQDPLVPPATEWAAYRIAAEALTNALRHAAARHVTLRLALDERNLVVEVADDGVGPPGPDDDQGKGLASMRIRAAEVRGHCVVLPAGPAGGTLVRAVLPRRGR